MDLRVRFLAVLVAALCAVGWIQADRSDASLDGVSASDGLGELPARRQATAKPPADRCDDDPGCLTVVGDALAARDGEPATCDAAAIADIRSERWWSSARPRGPPPIA